MAATITGRSDGRKPDAGHNRVKQLLQSVVSGLNVGGLSGPTESNIVCHGSRGIESSRGHKAFDRVHSTNRTVLVSGVREGSVAVKTALPLTFRVRAMRPRPPKEPLPVRTASPFLL